MPVIMPIIYKKEPTLQEKTATENGAVTADQGYDGLSKVTVNVEGGPQPQLFAPSISLAAGILSIVNPEGNGQFVTAYDLYVNGLFHSTLTETTIDLRTFGLVEWEDAITVKAKGTNFIDSEASNQATYLTVIPTLENLTWGQISKISEDGDGENYFAVGDCKEVALKGTVGTIELDATYCVYILGFDHNSEHEGTGIHFGTFKTAASGGKDIALVSDSHGQSITDGTKCFNTNHWGYRNQGGWAGCDMRYDILGSTDRSPSGYGAANTSARVGYNPTENCTTSPVTNTLMAALPAELRAVMKPMTKYTNNVGKNGDTEDKISITIDYLPLLSEFEAYGRRGYANSYEQNYQKQYDYFVAGNSIKKYKHSATTAGAYWGFRSAASNDEMSFVAIHVSGSVSTFNAATDLGLAPIFKV